MLARRGALGLLSAGSLLLVSCAPPALCESTQPSAAVGNRRASPETPRRLHEQNSNRLLNEALNSGLLIGIAVSEGGAGWIVGEREAC